MAGRYDSNPFSDEEASPLSRVMVFILLTFLVCGEKEDASIVCRRNQTPRMPEMKQQRQKQQQHQLPEYPFDDYFSEKREVPDKSDPLHNR